MKLPCQETNLMYSLGRKQKYFNWDQYLEQENCIAVPAKIFENVSHIAYDEISEVRERDN